MRYLVWLAVVVPALAIGITTLNVVTSLDAPQPWPLIAAEAAAMAAYIVLDRLISTLLAHRAVNRH